MSTSAQFRSLRVPSALVGNNAAWSTTIGSFMSTAVANKCNLRTLLSGAVTANTWKTLVSVTGAGVVHYCSLHANNATSKQSKLRITADGIVLVDSLMPGAAAANHQAYGAHGIGLAAQFDSTNQWHNVFVLDWIPFNASLLIEMQSTVSETDGHFLAYNYRTH